MKYKDFILFIYTFIIISIFTLLFIKNIKLINNMTGINIENSLTSISNSFASLNNNFGNYDCK